MLLSGDQLRRVIDVATNLVPRQHRNLFLRSLAGRLRRTPRQADRRRTYTAEILEILAYNGSTFLGSFTENGVSGLFFTCMHCWKGL
jgi:hypothetical protein